MERQLTLLPAIDDKKVQKEVVSVLKEYRALKMRLVMMWSRKESVYSLSYVIQGIRVNGRCNR
ncbi:putative phage transcriptional regulator, ArpU (plasmid) [Bacillus cereus 03BB108]|uniref:Phage transcriptional regulator, ArpU n=1 Tax=Bacillus cereus 03BB108 TaxID=451709 RepID=A0AAN0SS20_BACCE|nr:putative phage transcriptional regulator, ArpU [Bacillus cereus 03BB108]